ncbi:MAG TPA: GNAT family protein [Thermoanaerobaculia bacterium]|nr:GNAT family protein [Thermoanaerobaculia bacterium]
MIKGLRISLRAVEREDLKKIWEWENDQEVMAFASSAPERCISMEMLERSLTDVNPNGTGPKRLMALDEEGKAIGVVSYWVPNPRFSRSAEIGVYLGEKALWRQGYGTDAVMTLAHVLFRQLGMHRVGLATGSHNFRVLQAMQKHGVQVEGMIREERYMNGRFYDTVRLGVLEEEFDAIFQSWQELLAAGEGMHEPVPVGEA